MADPAYAIGSPSQAIVSIVNDDAPPDLLVTVMTVPATAPPGGSIQVDDTTKNQGTGTAPASTTGFYFSTNAVIDAADTLLGTRPIPMLAPQAISAGSVSLPIPAGTATGTYYIIAKADQPNTVTETQEGNNNRFRTTRVGPDLTVPALPAPPLAGAGVTINVSNSTKNEGSVATGATTTGIYLSSNTTYEASDPLLATRNVPGLAVGATSTVSTPVQIPAGTATGTHFLIAKADHNDGVLESLETNNTRSVAVKVGPDLTVSAGTVTPGSATAEASVTINDTTKNTGGGAAGPSTTKYYLSTNLTFDAADIFLGERTVAALAAGASSAGSKVVTIPPGTAVGNYYVIAVADGATAVLETAETNNTRSIFFRVVAGSQP